MTTTAPHSDAGRRPPRSQVRSAARLAAVQALYQMEQTGIGVEGVIREYVDHRLGREIDGETYHEADEAFFADLVRGVVDRQVQIDQLADKHLADGWRLSRLDSTLRAVLRAGIYELLGRADVPAKVVISEYVDVAKAFFEDTEPGFANGLLDKVARAIRPEDFAAPKPA